MLEQSDFYLATALMWSDQEGSLCRLCATLEKDASFLHMKADIFLPTEL